MTKEKISTRIEQFLDLCDHAKSIYQVNYDVVLKCDKVTQDFLHAIELYSLTYKQRAKLTSSERQNRIERRAAKDVVEEYEPIVKWLGEVPEAAKAINKLKQTLGEIRKSERYHEERTYVKRIRRDDNTGS